MTTENTDKPACPICEGTGVVDSVRPACGPPRWLDEPGEPMKPQDPRQWFPMDTAPRDGTVIVLRWGQDGESPGWWLKRKVFANGGRCYSWAFIDGGTDGRPFVNHAVDTEYGPTHWTPYTGPGYTIRSGDMCRHGKWASEPCEQCDGIRVLTTPPAATPAPAVERCETCDKIGRFYCFTHGDTPPAEAREPVGDAWWAVGRFRSSPEPNGAVLHLSVGAAIERDEQHHSFIEWVYKHPPAQPRDTLRDSGDAV